MLSGAFLKSHLGFMCVQHKPVQIQSPSTLSSGATAQSSGDHLAYVACSKLSGPPDSVRSISQHHSHTKPLPSALHPCEQH